MAAAAKVAKSDDLGAPVATAEVVESEDAFTETKKSNPKDNFTIDDGIDRDAEFDQYEKDEKKRKADQKAKDKADAEAEQKARDETKEKHEKQSEKLQFWAPVLFMGPLLPLIGSVISVSLGFLILMSEHKLNSRPLSIAYWFTSNCNYAFLYVVLESTFSAIFLFVVMIVLIDPGSTVIPNCCTLSVSRYCCKTAQCIAAWFGLIGSLLLILNLAAIPMLWVTRQCVFVSTAAVGENQNPYIWGTAAFLMVCYFTSWPILIFYSCQACGWKKERAKQKESLASYFTMKTKVDMSGYVPLRQEMAEDEAKEKEEKAEMAKKKKEDQAAQKVAKKTAQEAAKKKKNAVTSIAEIPVWPEGGVPASDDYPRYDPENDGLLGEDPAANGEYYGDQQYAEGGDQQYDQQYAGDQTW